MLTLFLKVGETYYVGRMPVICVNIRKNSYEFALYPSNEDLQFHFRLDAHQVEVLLETKASGIGTESFAMNASLVTQIAARSRRILGREKNIGTLIGLSYTAVENVAEVVSILGGLWICDHYNGLGFFPNKSEKNRYVFSFGIPTVVYFTSKCVLFVEKYDEYMWMTMYFVDKTDNPTFWQKISRWFR